MPVLEEVSAGVEGAATWCLMLVVTSAAGAAHAPGSGSSSVSLQTRCAVGSSAAIDQGLRPGTTTDDATRIAELESRISRSVSEARMARISNTGVGRVRKPAICTTAREADRRYWGTTAGEWLCTTIGTKIIAHRIGIPIRARKQPLHPVRNSLTGLLR